MVTGLENPCKMGPGRKGKDVSLHSGILELESKGRKARGSRARSLRAGRSLRLRTRVGRKTQQLGYLYCNFPRPQSINGIFDCSLAQPPPEPWHPRQLPKS